jgi:murein DD-endopeptidase MepM/ murein hydrolase activator NlpD
MTHSNPVLRYARLIIVVLVAILITVGVVRWITTRAIFREKTTTVPADITTQLDAQGVPISSYAAVDPAIIPALEAAGGFTAPDPLTVIAEGVPPLGVYLPSTGDTQFTLPKPTLTPAISPLPTITLTPPPTFTPFTQEITVTPIPTHIGPDGSPGPYPEVYGGDGCAPAGWPVAGLLTQYFHWYHTGIDIGIPLGSPVVATHSGTIIFAGWRTDGYGNLIILQNGAYITYYAHLTDFNVTEGQTVGRGSVIGWSGSTGNSTGPHVHYEVRINDNPVDPLTFEDRGYPSC